MTNLEAGAVVVALALIPLAAMWWIAVHAPLGWENEATGFHLGDEHAQDDNLGI